MRAFLVGVVSSLLFVVRGEAGLDLYRCSFCVNSVEHAQRTKQQFSSACRDLFPPDACDSFTDVAITTQDPRAICEAHGYCASITNEDWRRFATTQDDTSLDIRVAKAYGSKGYNKLRISVISNATIESEIFTYSSPFQYRWTDKVLNTGIISITPGETTSIDIAGEKFDIYVPSPTEGVRGVIIADPCFQSEWIVCFYQKRFNMFNHSTELINAIHAHDDVQYWSILGDNFYDQAGEATSTFFSALSKQAKLKIFGSTPGNHDFWVNASPKLYVKKDQLGNGFMQYYGQDVAASVGSSVPYDFSVNPDEVEGRDAAYAYPPASNYFYYNQIGNAAFIGFSGAHSFDEMTPMFEEACNWAASANPDVILLLGHWNSEGDGCEEGSTVPEAYENLQSLEACQTVIAKMKYVMGHKHCNIVTEPNVGYMVGAQGMSDFSDCGGTYGFPVFDSTEGRFRVYYFLLNTADGVDNYDSVLSCIKDNGVSGCYHLAEEWTNVPL